MLGTSRAAFFVTAHALMEKGICSRLRKDRSAARGARLMPFTSDLNFDDGFRRMLQRARGRSQRGV